MASPAGLSDSVLSESLLMLKIKIATIATQCVPSTR
jgi:hypothetical protein